MKYEIVKEKPFESAESALENCNDISEGVLSNTLKVFLEVNLPSVKKVKDSPFVLGVVDEYNDGCNGCRLILESVKPFKKRYIFLVGQVM